MTEWRKMTEAEWLACTDAPRQMLSQLPRPMSGRKLRLLLCGYCRPFRQLLSDPRILQAVEVCERYVDRRATREELAAANAASSDARLDLESRRPFEALLTLCVQLATLERITGRDVDGVAAISLTRGEVNNTTWRRAQCELIRELFGDPFRPAAVDPFWVRWSDGTVGKMTQAIYDERTFDRLPILADALEEAGCTDADILKHCRQRGGHVRGCWVVDVLLGKS
jgi:hypothetical protein